MRELIQQKKKMSGATDRQIYHGEDRNMYTDDDNLV